MGENMQFTQEDLLHAEKCGALARLGGMGRGACPAWYRGAMMDAWQRGWDNEPDPAGLNKAFAAGGPISRQSACAVKNGRVLSPSEVARWVKESIAAMK
jgi:hypothetical protein